MDDKKKPGEEAANQASGSVEAGRGSQGKNNGPFDSTGGNSSDIATELDRYLEKFDKLEGTIKKWNDLVTDSDKINNNIGVAHRKKRSSDFVPRNESEAIFTEKSERLQVKEIEQDISELGGKFKAFGFALDWPEKPNRTIEDLILDHSYYIGRYNRLEEIRPKIADVYNRLKEFSVMAEENRTIGTKTFEFEEENRLEEGQYLEMMKGVHIPSPSKAQVELTRVKESEKYINPWWPNKKAEEGKLEAFSKFWCHLVRNSTKFEKKDLTNERVTKTTQAILGWETHVKELNKKSAPEKFAFPTPVASEEEAVQPILSSIFRSLSSIPTESSKSTSRMDHSQVSAESTVRFDQPRKRYKPAGDGRPKQYDDNESSILQPFDSVLLDHESSLLKEMKNVRQKHANAQVSHHSCVDQMVGRLAKRALVAFDTADVGIDLTSVGLFMTPLYIQVIELSLRHMGSEDVSVAVRKTKLCPLVNEEAFKAIVPECKEYDQSREYLRSRLNLKEHGVPTGIEYLWQLLHTSDDELGVAIASKNQDATFIRKGESKASFKLGALLGAGSQGVVYSTVGESKNFVVKTGKTTSIKRELKALQILQASSQAPDEQEGRQYIPVIKDLGRVHYAIRSIVQDTPAFLIEPKGRPARSHLFNVDFDKRGAELIQLWKHVHAGLSYAHKKGIFHLDVSPSNIIYDGKQFLIIDWGSAAMAGERVWGLRGSRLYAHEDVHNNARREWAPKPIYDFVPLYYTLCTLKKGNRVPWKGFNIFYIPCEAYENRNKDTYKTLMDLVAIDASAFSSHLAPQTGTIKEMKLALRKELYIDHWLSDSDYRSSSDSTARSNGDSRDCLSSDSDDSSSD